MELVHGISTHFIQSKKFKTNKIAVRFTAPLSLDTIAGRMLSASMLETANQMYPTSQALRNIWPVYTVQICQPIVSEEGKVTL